ncbi:Rad9-domain-containing protein [Polychytrium aggregatum]|uniref:Rad9-domain-containing protein n=1 Tax=Polychytrium aggregatum TaxID=110093 RepID=UPI0022FE9F78|nr:Rad9-domain-containing protein [Polychytrium aggregatum]KAI9206975.1 Rad9-domain-containing protein [Polychytrium aggregatum]
MRLSTELVISAIALKGFSKFLQCLSKIGDDLYWEARADQLLLATVNSSRSAFVIFTLPALFFESYETENLDSKNFISCKILLKFITNIFKFKANLENVESCKIILQNGDEPDENQDRIVIQLICKHGVLKTHRLHYESCEPIRAVYLKETCQGSWLASPKVIHEWLVHFNQKLEEVTMICDTDWIKLKSFTDTSTNTQDRISQSLQTEVTMNSGDFGYFKVNQLADLTFNLKELKAILSFADTMNQPVIAYFERTGCPITFSVSVPDTYSVDFVLATLQVETVDPEAMGAMATTVPPTTAAAANHPDSAHIANSQNAASVHTPHHSNRSTPQHPAARGGSTTTSSRTATDAGDMMPPQAFSQASANAAGAAAFGSPWGRPSQHVLEAVDHMAVDTQNDLSRNLSLSLSSPQPSLVLPQRRLLPIDTSSQPMQVVDEPSMRSSMPPASLADDLQPDFMDQDESASHTLFSTNRSPADLITHMRPGSSIDVHASMQVSSQEEPAPSARSAAQPTGSRHSLRQSPLQSASQSSRSVDPTHPVSTGVRAESSAEGASVRPTNDLPSTDRQSQQQQQQQQLALNGVADDMDTNESTEILPPSPKPNEQRLRTLFGAFGNLGGQGRPTSSAREARPEDRAGNAAQNLANDDDPVSFGDLQFPFKTPANTSGGDTTASTDAVHVRLHDACTDVVSMLYCRCMPMC